MRQDTGLVLCLNLVKRHWRHWHEAGARLTSCIPGILSWKNAYMHTEVPDAGKYQVEWFV